MSRFARIVERVAEDIRPDALDAVRAKMGAALDWMAKAVDAVMAERSDVHEIAGYAELAWGELREAAQLAGRSGDTRIAEEIAVAYKATGFLRAALSKEARMQRDEETRRWKLYEALEIMTAKAANVVRDAATAMAKYDWRA